MHVQLNRSEELGAELREHLIAVQKSHPKLIKEVRGRGLLNAVVLHPAGLGNVTAYDVCIGLKNRGILAKPTHGNIIRLSPPLTVKYVSSSSNVLWLNSSLSQGCHLLFIFGFRATIDSRPRTCCCVGRLIILLY